MILEWLSTINVGEALLWLGAIGAVVGGIWKGWPAFRKTIERISRGLKLIDALVTLPEDIAYMKHELQDNSGKSVKDIATRTEKAVAELAAAHAETQIDVAHVKRQAASLKTSVRNTNKKLAAHIEASVTTTPEAVVVGGEQENQ